MTASHSPAANRAMEFIAGDHAEFLPQDVTGYAVILTKAGQVNGQPIRIIGGGDLIRLIESLGVH